MSSAKKDPLLDKKHQAILKKMMQNPENKTCADCKHASPRWASTNLGVFLCISCSGIHRKLGTHISKVRSITLDTWTASQIEHFQTLGNAVSAAHYEATLPPDFRRPSSTDAYAMERFIRDKYERQIYIAGATPSAAAPSPRPASYSMPASRTLGQRPTSYASPYSPPPQSAYDDSGRRDVPQNSYSYSSQFRNSSARQPSGGPASRHSYLAGMSQTSPTGISYQTSAVVLAITDMGFPKHLAEEAAARTGNNLQKAVDWVLKQEGTRSYNPPVSRPVYHPPPPPPQPAPVPDLLDFSTDAPAPANVPASKPVPKAMGLESLMGGSITAHAPKATPIASADDDFADFGAFESALPVESAPVVQASNPVQPARLVPSNGTSTLSSTLAGLYAQPVKSPPASTSPTPLSRQSNHPQIVKIGPSGLRLRRGPKNRVVSETLHSTPTRAVPQSLSLPLGQAGEFVQKLPTPPPPPMPTEADMFSNSSSIPPPPTTSPPLQANQGMSAKANRVAIESPKSPVQDAAAPAEDEDPFAFLSMQALSSATNKKKETKKSILDNATPLKATGNNKQTPGKSPAPAGATVPVGSATSGLTFEDLMG